MTPSKTGGVTRPDLREKGPGEGDGVSNFVTFSPWYANEAMTILGNTTTDDENDNQTVTLPSAILMTGDVMGIEIPAGIVVTGLFGLGWHY